MNFQALLSSFYKPLWVILLGLCFVQSPLLAVTQSSPRVDILCYHTFLGKPKIATDFSLDEFRNQLHTLQSKGVVFITLDDVLQGKISAKHAMVIFIDDGNISAMRAYREVLKPMGIRPVFAIYPAIISKTDFAMTWEDLRAVVADGCEIAAHGYYHLYLTPRFSQTDPKGFAQEIQTSKSILESKLGIPIRSYVYPFGLVSAPAKAMIRDSGYQFAFSLDPVALDLSQQDPYQLPRYMITRSWKPEQLTTH